jgi:hypothetical protein
LHAFRCQFCAQVSTNVIVTNSTVEPAAHSCRCQTRADVGCTAAAMLTDPRIYLTTVHYRAFQKNGDVLY